MNGADGFVTRSRSEAIMLHGARIAAGPDDSSYGSIEIAGRRVSRIFYDSQPTHLRSLAIPSVDLSGYLVLPGLINSHDHLEFSLYPRLADPPYRNYLDWGADIHRKFASAIVKQHDVPIETRLWWGGIRNLLCGVTTVCHHNPLWPELKSDAFPVHVVSEYGWAHSLSLGGDLRAAHAARQAGHPFIVHACEGTDNLARSELRHLNELGLLGEETVLVHGLAIDRASVALINERCTSLILCPSSNFFLYRALPDLHTLGSIQRLALGNDSPLTAAGDLLDEVRFAIGSCGISPECAYRMVTASPASILKLANGEGSIRRFGVADLVAVRDAGELPAERLANLGLEDVELVILSGSVRLASAALMMRLPAHMKEGLEPLIIGKIVRWLRAPVRKLLRAAEEVLGKDLIALGGRTITAPSFVESCHAI